MLLCLLIVLPGAVNAANDYYVSTTGSDNGAGSPSAPWKTLQHAAELAQPGWTIHVAPGTYTMTSADFTTTVSGTANTRIQYISDTKWGAKILPGPGSVYNVWKNNGSYTDIIGFDISGPNVRNGLSMCGANGHQSLQGNKVHDVGTSTPCDASGGSGISTGLWDGSVMQYGNTNDDVIGNWIYNIGPSGCNKYASIYIQTVNGTVANNIVYGSGYVGIVTWHNASNLNIVNNTIFNNLYGIIVGTGDKYNGAPPGDYFNVNNNIAYNNTYGIGEESDWLGHGTHNVYYNNLIYGNTNWNTPALYTNEPVVGMVNADPRFVNYKSDGSGDYHLQSISPAKDAGTSNFASATDYEGISRPQGAGYDIGAYEYVAPTAVAPDLPAVYDVKSFSCKTTSET
ncbi:MAG: choice-of-anchor Q domain-containing protein, partial [Chitinivibrionales bacterium]|nr:choice-of-anchor Q domain-containing protein [Chitinivibrionales bacterium]